MPGLFTNGVLKKPGIERRSEGSFGMNEKVLGSGGSIGDRNADGE